MSDRALDRPPGLDQALDLDAMQELVQGALRGAGAREDLESLNALDVRLRSDKPSWILYRAKLRDRDGRSRRRLLSARLARRDDPLAEPDPELVRSVAGEIEWLDRPVMRLPAQRITLFPYPLDMALPGLATAASEEAMARELQRHWSRRRLRVRSVRVRNLGYTPHSRAAFDYEVLAEWKDTREPMTRRLIGKLHGNKPAYRLFADSWAVWRAAPRSLGLAAPVGFLGPVGLNLRERVPGERLGGLVERPGFPRAVRRTARALVELHGLDVPLTARRKVAEEVKGVVRWTGILRTIRSDLAQRVERLGSRLVSEMEARIRVTGPVHADFHHTNVLVDGDRVTLIDLDEMAFGDPMLDVGRFLASLRVPARRAFGDVSALDDAGEGFLSDYLRRAGPWADERRVRLFEAGALVTSAGSSFRVQREGWREEVELLLAESERALERSLAGRPAAQPGTSDSSADVPRHRPDDPARWARDSTYMCSMLYTPVHEVYGARLLRCRIGSGSARDDSRIRYVLEGRRSDEEWSVEAEGVVRPRGGKGLLERIALVRDAAARDPEALQLPRPVAHLRELGLVVWEPPRGVPLSELIGSGRGTEAARAVGRALAGLHLAPADLDSGRTVPRELKRAEERLRSRWEGSPVGALALEVAASVRERLPDVPPREAPTLRTLRPRDVVTTGGGVGLVHVEEARSAHPWLDLADLLARLRLLGVTGEDESSALAARRALRQGYVEAWNRSSHGGTGSPGPASGALLTLEALAVLRLVSDRRPSSRWAAPSAVLLEGMRDALSTGPTEPAGPPVALAPPAGSAGGARSSHRGLAGTDRELVRRLGRSLARRCDGPTELLGDGVDDLAAELERRGSDVVAGSDASGPAGSFGTVILAGRLEGLPPEEHPAEIGRAWTDVRTGGTLVAVVPNGRPDGGDGVRATFGRKTLRRLLEPLGKPELVTDQPCRWIVMTLRKVEGRARDDGPSRTVRERYAATADLCRGRVLELGCGAGELCRLVADRGCEVLGVDLSERKIALAREAHPDLTFVRGDIRDVELDETGWDTVVLAEVLEHLTEGPGGEVLERAWSLVGPGGSLVVSVPNENCIPHPNHLRQFDEKRLLEMLGAFGSPVVARDQPYRWLMAWVDRGP